MKILCRTFATLGVLLFVLTLLTTTTFAQTVVTSVIPSATDPKIDTFDSPHTLYRNAAVKSRHELLVFLPGTNGKTRGTKLFCTIAAAQGYHVISLMYPDDISATVCRNDVDRDAFTKFRLEVIEGGNQSPHIVVDRSNSIENRLVKLLLYQKANHPEEEWGQFLTAAEKETDKPFWEKIAFAGQSQGGGHAALIARRHKVARVLLFSSPKDWSRRYDKPASWYKPSQTPVSRYFAFVHEQDKQGCSYVQQLGILKVMEMTTLGEPVSVDKVKPPYANSRILTTNFPGKPVTSTVAHTSEVSDGNTPENAAGEPLFKPVWLYMLTSGT